MSINRYRHTATFYYPGIFFPEETFREIPQATLEAVLAAAPTETDTDATYFVRDGWYGVKVAVTHEKLFTADDGEVAWVEQSTKDVDSWIVGEVVHRDQLDPVRDQILISNLEHNTEDGNAVRTRSGSYQFAKDWGHVLTPAQAGAQS